VLPSSHNIGHVQLKDLGLVQLGQQESYQVADLAAYKLIWKFWSSHQRDARNWKFVHILHKYKLTNEEKQRTICAAVFLCLVDIFSNKYNTTSITTASNWNPKKNNLHSTSYVTSSYTLSVHTFASRNFWFICTSITRKIFTSILHYRTPKLANVENIKAPLI